MDSRQRQSKRPLSVIVPLLALALALGGDVAAQETGSVTGRIVDSQSGAPVASAQIFITDLDLGVLTQQNGRYLLVNVPPGTHTLSFERIGYRGMTAEVTVGAGQTVVQDFSVSETALQLQEVLVTGTAGGTQRRAVGNAITRLDAADVAATRPVRNMQDMIQGRTTGLAFTRTGGQIGEASVMQVRGVSSFGLGSQPLIYIDGVRMDNSTELGPFLPNTGQGRRSAGAFDDLNPNDIESIEVIKGPAAATLYGTEASAGVIQIITKRGLPGAAQFDAQVTQGTNFVLDPRSMIGGQYRCPGATPCPASDVIEYNIFDLEQENAESPDSPLSNGRLQRYNLSVRGGVDQVNYFVSADYSDTEGARETNWNDQLSTRANLSVVIAENLDVDLSAGYVDGETRYSTGTTALGGLWPHIMWAQGLDVLARGYLAYTPEEFDIPEAIRDYSRFNASATISHSPFSFLDHRLTLGLDRGEEESQTLFPRDLEGADGPFGDQSLGYVDLLRPITQQISVDYGISGRYSPTSAITLTTSAGAQYYSNEFNRIRNIGLVFPAPAIRSIEGATETTATQTFTQNKSLGFYVQQELSWNDRVFITGAVRGDDNSAFGADFEAAIYPKVSATWVISEESFWNVGFINSMRLRGAWGKAGRQPDTFAAVTLFAPSVGSGGVAAVTPQTFGNANVGPEVGQELELGFDAAFLNDRISTEFTYFYQKTTDALVSVPLAPSEGFPGSQSDNLGQLDNWGYEVGVNARAFTAGDFSLDIGGQLSYTMNEIKDLGGRNPTNSLRLGYPWPNETTTFIEDAAFLPGTSLPDPASLMCDMGVSMAPDPNDPDQLARYGWEPGGPVVPCGDTRDHNLLMGTNFSPWHWSANATVGWRDLQVFALVDAEHGRWLNDFNISCRHDYCGFANSYAAKTREDPIFVQSSTFWFAFPSDSRMWADYDASYIRLREVGLRYQIPQSLLDVTRVDRASFSISARNLGYLWRKQEDVSGVPIPSPEIANPQSEDAFSLFQWPPLTSIEASLRVSF